MIISYNLLIQNHNMLLYFKFQISLNIINLNKYLFVIIVKLRKIYILFINFIT